MSIIREISATVNPSEESSDAFGRTRVSDIQTLLELSHLYDKQPELVDEITEGSGTSFWNINDSTVNMSVTTNTSDRVVRQTREYFSYQPGKSQLCKLTFVLHDSSNTGIICRVGYFDKGSDKTVDTYTLGDGIFLEYSGGNYYLVKRSGVTGTEVDTKVIRSSWDDPMDGSGESGINLDFTKAQIMFIDLQWLGVGTVRVGFIVNGAQYFAYTFQHANSVTTTYMKRGSLPIRYEIEQDVGTAAGTLKMICASVETEGGFQPIGRQFGIDMGDISTTVSGTLIPVLSIRTKAGYNRVPIKPFGYTVNALSNSDMRIIICKLPDASSLTGETWTSVNSKSAVEYDTSATALDTTDLEIITAQYFNGQSAAASNTFQRSVVLNSDIAGNQEILCIACEKTGGGSDNILASLDWTEWL